MHQYSINLSNYNLNDTIESLLIKENVVRYSYCKYHFLTNEGKYLKTYYSNNYDDWKNCNLYSELGDISLILTVEPRIGN